MYEKVAVKQSLFSNWACYFEINILYEYANTQIIFMTYIQLMKNKSTIKTYICIFIYSAFHLVTDG